MTIDTADCKAMMLHVAIKIQGDVDMLNEADSMGDSDHGTGMGIGFAAVARKLSEQEPTDIASLFKSVGMAIMMNAGGASGALFGSFFKDGAKALEGVDALDTKSFTHFLQMGLGSVMRRGKATKGDKTMVDALIPAVESAIAHGDEPLEIVVLRCAEKAHEGSEETRTMIAKLGRMKLLGTRTVGHVDPGSITSALLFKYMGAYVSSLQK